jgi:hypothetical protein
MVGSLGFRILLSNHLLMTSGNVGDYTGPRDTEGIVSWVNSNMS